MPKLNQTMLDRLVDAFKGGSQHKPEIIQQTTFRDPLGYTMEQRRAITRNPQHFQKLDMTPERRIYQRGIEARLYPKKIAADELLDEANENRDRIQDEWKDAVDDAKESMREDWETGLDYQAFEDVDPYYLEVDEPSTDLREYWPSYARSPEEIGESFNSAQDAYYDAKDAQKRIYSTRGIMDEQLLTPRYRRYQDAMQRRDINRRAGRVNAAIMNLARQGYSLPEIREILRRQGR